MGNTYEEFAQRLRASIPGVLAITGWLYRNGWAVSLPALVLRPKNAPYQDYQDRGDLFATKGDKACRFEVKYSQRRAWWEPRTALVRFEWHGASLPRFRERGSRCDLKRLHQYRR